VAEGRGNDDNQAKDMKVMYIIYVLEKTPPKSQNGRKQSNLYHRNGGNIEFDMHSTSFQARGWTDRLLGSQKPYGIAGTLLHDVGFEIDELEHH